MDTDNRKFTILSFFIFSALCGFVFYLMLTAVADLMKIGGSNVVAGLSWPVVGGVASSVATLILFMGLAINKKATGFTDDVFAEVKKTTWPGSKETTSATVVVSIMVGIAALMFFLMDWVWGIVFRIIL